MSASAEGPAALDLVERSPKNAPAIGVVFGHRHRLLGFVWRHVHGPMSRVIALHAKQHQLDQAV